MTIKFDRWKNTALYFWKHGKDSPIYMCKQGVIKIYHLGLGRIIKKYLNLKYLNLVLRYRVCRSYARTPNISSYFVMQVFFYYWDIQQLSFVIFFDSLNGFTFVESLKAATKEVCLVYF